MAREGIGEKGATPVARGGQQGAGGDAVALGEGAKGGRVPAETAEDGGGAFGGGRGRARRRRRRRPASGGGGAGRRRERVSEPTPSGHQVVRAEATGLPSDKRGPRESSLRRLEAHAVARYMQERKFCPADARTQVVASRKRKKASLRKRKNRKTQKAGLTARRKRKNVRKRKIARNNQNGLQEYYCGTSRQSKDARLRGKAYLRRD